MTESTYSAELAPEYAALERNEKYAKAAGDIAQFAQSMHLALYTQVIDEEVKIPTKTSSKTILVKRVDPKTKKLRLTAEPAAPEESLEVRVERKIEISAPTFRSEDHPSQTVLGKAMLNSNEDMLSIYPEIAMGDKVRPYDKAARILMLSVIKGGVSRDEELIADMKHAIDVWRMKNHDLDIVEVETREAEA